MLLPEGSSPPSTTSRAGSCGAPLCPAAALGCCSAPAVSGSRLCNKAKDDEQTPEVVRCASVAIASRVVMRQGNGSRAAVVALSSWRLTFPVIQRTPHVVDGRRKQPVSGRCSGRNQFWLRRNSRLHSSEVGSGEASAHMQSSQSHVGLGRSAVARVQNQLPRYGGGPIGVRGRSPCGHGAARRRWIHATFQRKLHRVFRGGGGLQLPLEMQCR